MQNVKCKVQKLMPTHFNFYILHFSFYIAFPPVSNP